jgi:hypothetical protein
MTDSNIRNSYNLKKIKKFNNIDKMYNQDELKNMILKPTKIEKPNINIKSLLDNKEKQQEYDLNESIKKRTNNPYKGIIKDFDYSKIRAKHEEDLIVHKVTQADKDTNIFEQKMGNYNVEIKKQNNDFKEAYSIDKKTEHKKEFDYKHKYKYRTKIDTDADGSEDLRIDRIEFWKKEQNKIEDNKKKMDDILLNLIDMGVLSENLNTIDYDKIDADDFEHKLKNIFGEEEFEKLLKELG